MEQGIVNKYYEIQYKSQLFYILLNYSVIKIEVIEFEDKIETNYREPLFISHPYN